MQIYIYIHECLSWTDPCGVTAAKVHAVDCENAMWSQKRCNRRVVPSS